MAIALVQGQSNHNNGVNNLETGFTYAFTSGNSIICAAQVGSTGGGDFPDPACYLRKSPYGDPAYDTVAGTPIALTWGSNTDNPHVINGSEMSCWIGIFWWPNVTIDYSEQKIVVYLDSSGSYKQINAQLYEFSGLGNAVFDDKGTANNGDSTSWGVNNTTTTYANELWFAMAGIEGTTAYNLGYTSGWLGTSGGNPAQITNSVSGHYTRMISQYKIVSSTGNCYASGTISGTQEWAAIGVSLAVSEEVDIHPTAIASTLTVPSPGIIAGTGAIVTPDDVACAAIILAPPNISTGLTADCIDAVGSVPTPTVEVEMSATAEPTCVSASTEIPTPSAHAGVGIDVSSVDAIVSIDTPSVHGGAVPEPACINGQVSIDIPDLSGELTADCVDAATTIPTPSVSTEGNVDVHPTCVDCVAEIPTPTIAISHTVSVTTVNGTATVPTPAIQLSIEATPTCVSATTAVPTPAAQSGSLVEADSINAVASVPTPTVTTESATIVNLAANYYEAYSETYGGGVVRGRVIIPAPTLYGDVNIEADTVNGAAYIPTPNIQIGSGGIMVDVTPYLPDDGQLDIEEEFFNYNVRDALMLLLAPPTCVVTKTNTQTFYGSGVWTWISWNNVVSDSEDPDTPIWSVSYPTRLTCRTAGWYEISVSVPMYIDVAGNSFTVAYRINGTNTYIGDTCEWEYDGLVNHAVSYSTLLRLTVDDYVEIGVKMSRNADLTSITTWNTPRCSIQRMRGL